MNFLSGPLKNASSGPTPFQKAVIRTMRPGDIPGKVNSATYPQTMDRKEEGQGSPVSFSSPSQILAGGSELCSHNEFGH